MNIPPAPSASKIAQLQNEIEQKGAILKEELKKQREHSDAYIAARRPLDQLLHACSLKEMRIAVAKETAKWFAKEKASYFEEVKGFFAHSDTAEQVLYRYRGMWNKERALLLLLNEQATLAAISTLEEELQALRSQAIATAKEIGFEDALPADLKAGASAPLQSDLARS